MLALAGAALGLLALGWTAWPGTPTPPGRWRVLEAASGAQSGKLIFIGPVKRLPLAAGQRE